MSDNTDYLPIYGITSADYLDYPDTSFIDMITDVTDKFNQQLRQWSRKNSRPDPLTPTLPSDYQLSANRLLILWKNIPIRDDLSSYNEYLLYTFCKNNLADPNNILYIDNVEAITMGSFDTLFRRLYMIHSFNNTMPYFMQENTIYKYSLDELREEWSDAELLDLPIANKAFFDHFMTTINNFMKLTDSLPDLNVKCSNFIKYYFAWQSGDMVIREICDKLRNAKQPDKPLSKSVFYGMVESFEKSPVYAEFLKCYPDIWNEPKKGPVSGMKVFVEQYESSATDSQKLKMCRDYNLVSLIDLNRTYIACKKKSVSTRRHKNL